MNYSSFLNKNNKFKNKNQYRLESKKKISKLFLTFSVITIATLSIFITFFIDIDRNTIAQAAQPPSNTQSTPLELPAIDYGSDVTPHSIIYSEESDSNTNQAVQKQITITTKSISTDELTEAEPSLTANITPTLAHAFSQSDSQLIKINKSLDIDVVSSSTNEKAVPVTSEQPEVIHSQQVTVVPLPETTTTKKVVIKKGDSLSAIFKRLSLSSSTLHKIMNSSKQAKRLTQIKPGQELMITFDHNDKFMSLHYNLDKIDSLIVEKIIDKKQYLVRIESKEIDTKQQFATGIITNSLFSTANKSGLSDAMTMQLAHLFGWDIDFALDIRKGDSFAVLFEEKFINGEKIGNGNILSAEFVNRGKVFTAIRYTDAANHTDYYSEKGFSMRKAFLRTPVDFSRISSRFSSGRKHPVLNRIRAHKGVDYAAARGTPIKAVGDGKVIYKGKKGGYGRVIILQHGSKYSTLYAHMNSYNKKIRHGTRVKQGQIIGYVGSSGLATGPHLHYEFRMNGAHRNPLTVPLPSASPIAKKYRSDFQTTAETMISQLKLRKLETVALSEQ